jgi:hypothetical protein
MQNLKLVFAVFLLVATAYLCWALIPPYFANYQLNDVIENEARLGTYSTRTDDDIRNEIFKKAQDLEIPISREEIKVLRGTNQLGQGTGGVTISVDYTVHVNVPGYPLDLKFHSGSKNKSIY